MRARYMVSASTILLVVALAAVIVINSGGQLVTMDGSDPSIVIPVVMITNEHGTLIRENLPATATVRSNPEFE